MLDLCTVFARLIGQPSIAAEVEVGERDLIVAFLLMNHFAVVEHLYSEVFGLEIGRCGQLAELLFVFRQSHVHGGTSVVGRRDDELLLEDDAILGRDVGVRVLERLALLDILKLEGLVIT